VLTHSHHTRLTAPAACACVAAVIRALTDVAEHRLCELLSKAHSIAIHGRRLIVFARDIKLARALSGPEPTPLPKHWHRPTLEPP